MSKIWHEKKLMAFIILLLTLSMQVLYFVSSSSGPILVITDCWVDGLPKKVEKGTGVWVYNFSDFNNTEVIHLLANMHIKYVYLSLDVRKINPKETFFDANYTSKLTDFIGKAKTHGIHVYAMTLESPLFVFEDYHENGLNLISDVIEYCRHNPDKSFFGIVIDVEPWTLEEWREGSWAERETLMSQFLKLLIKISMTLHNTDNVSLIFSACIPWWSNEQADRGNLPSGDTWEIGKYVDIVIPLVYDGIGHTVDDIVLRVSDEIIERPTVVGINAKEFASYEELLSTIQNLDSFYANNSNYLGCSIFEYRSLLELYKLKESHSVYPLIGRGLQAIDALENGVLESANLADSRTLGAAIQGLKTAISLIPVPATKLAVKVTGKLAKFTIKELVAWIMEQQIDVDTLHEFYLQGYFSDTMTEMRKEIISLDPDLQQYKDIFPADAEFVVDLQAYLDYVQQVGTNYPAQLSNLIEAHEARKEEMLVNDLIILGGGIALIVVTGGTGTPVLFYSAFDKSYTLVTGINDIEEEVELYYCLVATCHRQSDEAIYYANQIAKGLQYISEKIKTNDFSFPKITVTPFADGGALVKNDCHKAVRVKVEHLVTLRTEIPPDSIPPSPEALETHQYGNTYELSLGMGEEVFFLKPPPPDSIEEWIDKVSRWNLKIEETVLIRVFYGEEETGPVALKSCLSKCDYLVHEEYDETIKDYGTMEGTTAAIIDIKVEGQEISSEVVAKIRDLDIQIEAQPNKVIVKVGSVKEKGRTITINIDKTVLSIEEINEVSVLYDGKEIKLADNYTDVLNPNDEHNPEYLVLIGAEGIQVLVSIPNFSTHTITVAKRTVAYNIFSWFNQILFGIPIIGDIVRFLDTIIPGYGSLLFIIISVASLILLVVLMSKLK